MGYTTEFDGQFQLNKKLDEETHKYLVKFNQTRRMKRTVGPEFGVEGEFYVDGSGEFGQGKDPDIIDYNRPPITQPGLWCKWRPSDDGAAIEWDGVEKFYDYVEWLEYLIANFLAPKGYVLNGRVKFRGEDFEDFGTIIVRGNKVRKVAGSYEGGL